jgi:hypothetical protein
LKQSKDIALIALIFAAFISISTLNMESKKLRRLIDATNSPPAGQTGPRGMTGEKPSEICRFYEKAFSGGETQNRFLSCYPVLWAGNITGFIVFTGFCWNI